MHREKRKKMWVLLTVLVALLSAVGLTYAWMAQRASMTTLLTITPPDSITIIPTSTDGSELTALDLDFHENSDDEKDGDGTIHIYRPVCIKSTEPIHRMEIVHTTNLNDLDFNIYPATKTINDGKVIIQKSDSELSGDYKNRDNNETSKLAIEEVLENYNATGDVADRNAYPLYWIAVNCAIEGKCEQGWREVTSYTETGADQKTYYNTYYMLEISWKDETKETDLFYIMAQNVAE